MNKVIKVIWAIILAIAVSAWVNFLLVWTSLWDNGIWRTVLNIVELLWVVVAVIIIIKTFTNKSNKVQ